MIGLGTAYAGAVLAVSVAFYLALRAWYGLDRGTAGGLTVLGSGLVLLTLGMSGRLGRLDAGVACAAGVLGWWIFESPQGDAGRAHAGEQEGAAPPAPGVDPRGSRDLVLRQIERRADLAVHEADALDNKAGFVLGAASFLLLGVTGLQGIAASHMREMGIIQAVQWLAIGSVVIYLGVAGAALTAYMVHESVILPEPVAFERDYSSAPEEATTAYLIQAQLGAYAANQTIIAKKTRWTLRALRAFLAETVFLALILIAIAVTL